TDAITRASRAGGCDSSHARAAAIRAAARSEIMISREAGIDAARLDAAPQPYRLPRGSGLARGRAALFPQSDNGCQKELLIQVHRIADANPARRTDRREYADVSAMMKRGGA